MANAAQEAEHIFENGWGQTARTKPFNPRPGFSPVAPVAVAPSQSAAVAPNASVAAPAVPGTAAPAETKIDRLKALFAKEGAELEAAAEKLFGEK